MKVENHITLLDGLATETVAARTQMVVCPELAQFEANELAVARRGFIGASTFEFRQAWLPKAESRFAPGVVRVGWRADVLLVFAELTDADIVSDATTSGQRLWELGDTFEIFLQPHGSPSYVELHVAPGNQRLQMRYDNAAIAAHVRVNGGFASVLLPGDGFHSVTWVEPRAQRWFVYAEVPAVLVGCAAGSLAARQWRFSFGRYDYTRGHAEPVISSTSPHAEPDFHRRHEWNVLAFQPSTAHQPS